MKRWAASCALALALMPAAALAAKPRTSLAVVLPQVMCVSCKIPLAVAQSPQADQERRFIRALIARGETLAQIKARLVATYGDGVLALPPARGFDLTVYVVPVVAVLAALALLAFLLPRWRRSRAAPAAAAAPLSASDERRLDEELARFERERSPSHRLRSADPQDP